MSLVLQAQLEYLTRLNSLNALFRVIRDLELVTSLDLCNSNWDIFLTNSVYYIEKH